MAPHDEPLALRLTGGLLVAIPVAFTAIFVALGAVFDYPDILGAPTDEVLGRFAAGGDGLVALWYGFMLTAVGFVPIAVLLPRVLGLGGALAATSVVFGVLAGAAVRRARPLAVPRPLPRRDLPRPAGEPRCSRGRRRHLPGFQSVRGGAIGEHLGYLFTAVWTLLLAAGLHRVLRRPWLAALGAVSGLGIAVGMLEPLGVEAAGLINAVAYSAWALWLVILGVLVLRGSQKHSPPAGEDT